MGFDIKKFEKVKKNTVVCFVCSMSCVSCVFIVLLYVNSLEQNYLEIPESGSKLLSTNKHNTTPGIILCMHPANERRRYIETSSLIG